MLSNRGYGRGRGKTRTQIAKEKQARFGDRYIPELSQYGCGLCGTLLLFDFADAKYDFEFFIFDFELN